MGKSALYSNTTGGNNTAIGISTLRLNTTGYNNTAIGASALYSNTTGSNNTAIGASALNRNTTGGINTAIGISTLYRNTTGYYNIAIGSWTFQNNTTGYKNTVVGNVAGASNVTGSNNTLVGFAAEVGTGNLNNATAIGYEAIATSSNQARIGSNLVSSIGGYANWSNISDGRAKKNIRTDVPGLDFIKLLQPVTFNLDLDIVDELLKIDKTKKPNKEELSPEAIEIDKKSREAKEKVVQTGFIAQDVEKVAQSIGYDFSGVDVDETGIYGLRYAEFVVPLVKAAQELSERNDSLQAQVSDLTKQVNDLTKLVHSLLENEAASASLKSENVVELTTGLQELTNSGVSLQQNSPNPFNQSTVIRYTLPKTDKQAQIAISNIAGQIIKQIPLRLGTDSITIERGAFPAGIYYYSLYVGNSLIDTKKMILTN
jgi:hypothetical protein